MRYTARDKLAILQLDHYMEPISFETLTKKILDRPSNIIYCEKDGKLIGIISMGDIARTDKKGKNNVLINTRFTYVYSENNMSVRDIFSKKKSINAIPVVDINNSVVGAYERWDNLKCERIFGGGEGEYNEKIVLVRPCRIFADKQTYFMHFYNYLISLGISVECIEHREVLKYVDKETLILLADEDERRAIDTFVKYIMHQNLKRELKTYKQFIQEQRYEFAGAYLRKLKKHGINILNLVCSWNYELNSRISEKFRILGEKVSDKMPPAMYSGFLGEQFTQEYADIIMHIPFSIETRSHIGKLKDCNGKFYNVRNGERYTYGQPKIYQKTIYFVGPCFIYGHYVEDRNTIESILQKKINEIGKNIRVVNCGSFYYNNMDLELARIMELPLKKGDIIILYLDGISFYNIPELDIMEVIKNNYVSVEWMVNCPMHCNDKINTLYAKAIFDRINPLFEEIFEEQGKEIDNNKNFVKSIYIDRYFNSFNSFQYENVGAIVMNCNPFTYGHRYLIEQALHMVDFLIIFVVQENRSLFNFEERFSMVSDGCADLKNVMVVPSGSFILSQVTFPEYFIKEADADMEENMENDILFFAEEIAPYLNIKYRFVGEEPEDKVTAQYNITMKKTLLRKGIKVIEIPRKKQNGKYISASLVRRCLQNNEMDKLQELVPESTRAILQAENC